MKLLIVLILALLSLGALCQDLDYGIMIDAGSTGSRIFLYQWPHRAQNTLPLVEPTSINQTAVSNKNTLALASFNTNPANAGKSLESLIAYIKSKLNQSEWSVTPIYLKATAGMRALSQSDQNAIIANVRQYLRNTSTNPFEFKDDYAKVIPGTDEGVFGWITVNYALKVLATLNPTTEGALDMGGASTQITFLPSSAPSQNLYNFSLGPNQFPLYTYSYPLGADQANRLIISGLLADNVVDAEGNILNACYLEGYNETYLSGPTLVLGTGNYAECQAAVLKYVVTSNSSCSSCGIGNVYQPPIIGNFYAFSGFTFTYAFLNLSKTASIAEIRIAAQGFCNLTWAEANAISKDRFLKQYCFTSTFFSEILLKYGFDINSHQVTVQSAIGKIEISWALGGMIYEANLLPFGGELPGKPTEGPGKPTEEPIDSSSASSLPFTSIITTFVVLVIYLL